MKKHQYSTVWELQAKSKKALKGRWVIASIAFLLILLFGLSSGGISVNVESDGFVYLTAAQEADLQGYLDNGDIVNAVDLVMSNTRLGSFLFLMAAMSVIAFLYSLFVATPLRTGYYRFNLELYTRKKEVRLGTLRFGFKHRYWKSVGTFILQELIITANVLVGSLIGGFFIGFGVVFGRTLIGAILVLIGIAALIGMLVRVIQLMLNYAMVGYVLADREDLSPRQILAESTRLMKGNRGRLCLLYLSFVPYIYLFPFLIVVPGIILAILGGVQLVLLLILVLLAAVIAFGAFCMAAEAAFYRELVKGGKRTNLLESLFSKN